MKGQGFFTRLAKYQVLISISTTRLPFYDLFAWTKVPVFRKGEENDKHQCQKHKSHVLDRFNISTHYLKATKYQWPIQGDYHVGRWHQGLQKVDPCWFELFEVGLPEYNWQNVLVKIWESKSRANWPWNLLTAQQTIFKTEAPQFHWILLPPARHPALKIHLVPYVQWTLNNVHINFGHIH